MAEEKAKIEIPPYDQSGVHCPQCKTELPKSLFMRFVKKNFVRYFLFTFCLSFTLVTLIVDVRHHYSANDSIQMNPYYIALIFAGSVSLIGWLSQKQNDLRKELAEKGATNSNAQS